MSPFWHNTNKLKRNSFVFALILLNSSVVFDLSICSKDYVQFSQMAVPEVFRPQYLVDSISYRMRAPAQKLGCRRSSRFIRYFPSERTSQHKSASLQPLHSQQRVFLSEIRRKLLIVASFSSIRTLFVFNHSLHFCVS